MKLTIGGVDYTFEFTIEATLCEPLVDKITKFMFQVAKSDSDSDLEDMVTSIADIPGTAFAMFYGGLLENHSDKIRSEKDAKRLLAEFFKENKDDKEKANYYWLFRQLLEQVKEDGFFDLIGLETILDEMTKAEADQTREEKPPVKKASTKVTKH